MLELFRKNLFIYNIFLVLYCIILRASWFFLDVPMDYWHAGILSHYLYSLLGAESIAIKILGILILSYQAVQINRLVSLNRLTTENTLFPGLFYILIASLTLTFVPLIPCLLANTFIITMLLDVFKQTRNIQLSLNTFNVGLWIGLASLFYFPYVAFFIMGMMGVLYLRTFKAQDLLRGIMGLIMPYFLLGTGLFLADRLQDMWSLHVQGSLAFLDLAVALPWKAYVIIGVYAIMILMAIGSSNRFSTALNIHGRRKIAVLFNVLLGGGVLMALVAETHLTSLLFMTVPLSILLAAMFLELDNQLAEVLHFILLVLALAFQFLL